MDWRKTGKILNSIDNTEEIIKVKYENLINSFENLQKLLKFLDINSDKEVVEKCLNAPVVGSSFGANISKQGSNWVPEIDKSKFVFIEKWRKWVWFKKSVFKFLAGKQLIELGYEKDNNW